MRHDTQHPQSMTAERFLALSQVGAALMRELDEERLLHLIARTACELTGAAYAAFSLRPIDEEGQPLVTAEGALFHLAAITGVTAEQEALLRRMPLGGEGLLAPIFRYGVPVLVSDAFAHLPAAPTPPSSNLLEVRKAALEAARAYAQGLLPAEALPSLGIPAGLPVVRSFLGVPVLDRAGQVRGGLLLGHEQPGQFTDEDQAILIGLAGQAAVALENARLHQLSQLQAEELQAMFDSIADGITLVDCQGRVRRENAVARQLRRSVQDSPQAEALQEALLSDPAHTALASSNGQPRVVQVSIDQGEQRDYLVTARQLRPPAPPAEPGTQNGSPSLTSQGREPGGVVVVWHDVTDRRLREDALLAQGRASYLETIFEAMTDGVYVYDRQGRIVQTNIAAQEILDRVGLLEMAARPAQERLAKFVVANIEGQLLTPEQLAPTRILQGEEITPEHALELQMPQRDGTVLYLSTTGGPIRDARGEIIGAVAISRDISEQKRAERKREEQTQQLRMQASLIDLAHDAILVRDPSGHIVSWNRGAERLYGWTAQEVVGQVTHLLLQTHFPVPREEIYRLLEQDGIWEGELVHKCRDGRLVVVESRWALLRDAQGQPSAALEINRDVTERRRLEWFEREAYAEIEGRLNLLQTILNELPSCIYLVRGPQARLVLANRAADTVFGATWTPGQPLQAFLSQHGIRVLKPEGRPLPFEQMAVSRALQQGETVRQKQKVIWHPDQTALPVLVNAVPLDAAQLSIPGEAPEAGEAERAALVVYADVTALKEADALKDEFLSIATHELRSPVAVLKGYADMLLRQSARGKGAPLSESQQEGLQEIARTAMRLDELMRDVLDVTRLQMEQRSTPAEPIDLVTLTEQVVRQQQVTTQIHHITLQTPYSHLVVNMNPKRLEQVLTNLLGNAIKYSPQGGPIEVTLETEDETEVALLSIRDHGIGIPAQQQARIFGRFARAENAGKLDIAGTGLGLYLAREMIERYGGRIWFESTEGVGSVFFVALPLVTRESLK